MFGYGLTDYDDSAAEADLALLEAGEDDYGLTQEDLALEEEYKQYFGEGGELDLGEEDWGEEDLGEVDEDLNHGDYQDMDDEPEEEEPEPPKPQPKAKKDEPKQKTQAAPVPVQDKPKPAENPKPSQQETKSKHNDTKKPEEATKDDKKSKDTKMKVDEPVAPPKTEQKPAEAKETDKTENKQSKVENPPEESSEPKAKEKHHHKSSKTPDAENTDQPAKKKNIEESKKPVEPAKETTKPKPKPKKEPKPKKTPPLPKEYLPEPGTEQYNQMFTIFADTFYTYLHMDEKHKPKYAKQLESLVPVVTQGPKEEFSNISVFKPKKEALKYREYDAFRDKVINTTRDQSDVDSIKSDIKAQMDGLVSDAKILNKYGDKAGVQSLMKYQRILTMTFKMLDHDPYWITEVIEYGLPIVNDKIKPNEMVITIRNGSNLPTSTFVLQMMLPLINFNNEEVVYTTKKVKGPTVDFGFTKTDNFKFKPQVTSVQRANAEIRLFNPGNQEPFAKAFFLLSPLMRNRHLELTIPFQHDEGTGLIKVTFDLHSSLGILEKRPVKKLINIHPMILFNMKPTKKAGEGKPAPKPAAVQQKTAAPKAQKPAMTPEEAKKQLRQPTSSIPQVYIFTDDELQLTWPGKLMKFKRDDALKHIEKYKEAGLPPQLGLVNMYKVLSSKIDTLEMNIQNELLSLLDYIKQVEQSILREKEKLATFPPELRAERTGYVKIMHEELNELKSYLEQM